MLEPAAPQGEPVPLSRPAACDLASAQSSGWLDSAAARPARRGGSHAAPCAAARQRRRQARWLALRTWLSVFPPRRSSCHATPAPRHVSASPARQFRGGDTTGHCQKAWPERCKQSGGLLPPSPSKLGGEAAKGHDGGSSERPAAHGCRVLVSAPRSAGSRLRRPEGSPSGSTSASCPP